MGEGSGGGSGGWVPPFLLNAFTFSLNSNLCTFASFFIEIDNNFVLYESTMEFYVLVKLPHFKDFNLFVRLSQSPAIFSVTDTSFLLMSWPISITASEPTTLLAKGLHSNEKYGETGYILNFDKIDNN